MIMAVPLRHIVVKFFKISVCMEKCTDSFQSMHMPTEPVSPRFWLGTIPANLGRPSMVWNVRSRSFSTFLQSNSCLVILPNPSTCLAVQERSLFCLAVRYFSIYWCVVYSFPSLFWLHLFSR